MPCDKMKPMDFALEGWIEVAQEGWIDTAYKKVYNVVRQKVATDLHTDRFDCSCTHIILKKAFHIIYNNAIVLSSLDCF